ncbi:RAMP superfamily CRISPR-associated protein [Lusitaniella coriacea]|uniref:RAMP superfamily CRISPR-associated protein n=1 Tax=Lusitaniella coriacea TaxID=1983105 RepID=UPI003CF722CC
MYQKAYGIIETLAPLHVGASAGEETGNLNLIFRDQFTLTGIIPGSSIRGRFRADMRSHDADKTNPKTNHWYGHEAIAGQTDGGTTEALVKFEYASLVWLPVFCPGQPVVWVTCPRLLKRYQMITGTQTYDKWKQLKPYTASENLSAREVEKTIDGKKQKVKILFFNLGFLDLKRSQDLSDWIPPGVDLPADKLVIVDDNDIATIHDMALYRQSRTKLQNDMKKVENFFGLEALPEGCILAFPVGIKEKKQDDKKSEGGETDKKEAQQESTSKQYFADLKSMSFETLDNKKPEEISKELYFGGLESIGMGRCNVTLVGE